MCSEADSWVESTSVCTTVPLFKKKKLASYLRSFVEVKLSGLRLGEGALLVKQDLKSGVLDLHNKGKLG